MNNTCLENNRMDKDELVLAITFNRESRDFYITNGDIEKSRELNAQLIEIMSVLLGKEIAQIDNNPAKCYTSLGVAMKDISDSFKLNLQAG